MRIKAEQVTITRHQGIGEAARSAGVTPRFLLYVLKGERKMSAETAARLRRAGVRLPA
jgi:plasmid maintenance system antidote protein VapI